MIIFTNQEIEIFNVIRNYAKRVGVIPRLVGGFVRDKIMNLQSSDIDVALDTMTGYNFAIGLAEYINEDKKAHKIKANPDKSKHLETAVLNIHGVFVDFVNLRSEKYTDSRIPIISSGTAEEDAFRRDVTINTLFYNLITEEVEDFTGRGLIDLINGVIDTPLDPEATLKDDPLRILRIIRFGCKFDFKISDRIHQALKNQEIKEHFKTKISNERVGIEIFKMLDYNNGCKGLLTILKSGYFDAVFKIDVFINSNPSSIIDFCNTITSYNFLERYSMKKKSIEEKIHININCSAEHEKIIVLYALLFRYIGIKISNGKKHNFLNVLVLKESLKTSKTYFSAIEKIESAILYILEMKIENIDVIELVVAGGSLWKEVLLILCVCTGNKIYLDKMIIIFDQKLENCFLQRPVITGDFLISKGEDKMQFKRILHETFILQIRNPNLSQEELFELYLRI